MKRYRTVGLVSVILLSTIVCNSAIAQLSGRQAFTVVGHRAFVLEPPKASRIKGPMPWVWYAPTFDKRLPNRSEKWMIDRLHAEGIAVAGVDVVRKAARSIKHCTTN